LLVEFDPATRTFGQHRQLDGTIPGGAITLFNRAGDRLLVASDWNDQIQLYDVGTGRLVFEVPPTITVVRRFHFDPSGRRLSGARRGTQLGLWSIGDGREYRVLAPGRPTSGPGRAPAVSPDGRVAAVNAGGGLGLYDLDSGRELAIVPFRPYGISDYRCGALAFEQSGALLTNSKDGFFRWPLRPGSSSPDRLRLGPPERLAFHEGASMIAVSHNGRVIVQAMYAGYGEEAYAGGWILHADRPGEPRHVAANTSMSAADVSRDGRWAAFGAHMTQVIVFDTATGREAWRSPGGGHHGRFTPDGRWLVTGADGGRAYAVGSWEPGAQLGPGQVCCISPDSRLAVLSLNEGSFRLVEVATGREVATLEDPDRRGGLIGWLTATFTPDGTRLVVPAKEGLRVWDLRAIRRELATLGLDWDAPSYPAAKEPAVSPPALTVEVVGVEVLANDADAANDLAWRLVTGPKPFRDPDQALPLTEKAVKLAPEQWAYHNTLGVVYYRLGRYTEAVTSLSTSLEHDADQSGGFDLYVLAMCHHRLGDAARAKDCFDRAVRWHGQAKLRPEEVEDLNAFRAEAAAVLRGPPGR
jgi:WD40 repeat protein